MAICGAQIIYSLCANRVTHLKVAVFLSTTKYTNITLPFSSPGFAVGGFNVSIGNRFGTLYTRGWAVFAGSSVDTQVRGNLNVPY